MIRKYIILIACNFLFFDCDLFSFIAQGLFNCFARIFIITIIILIFFIHIYLVISFIPTLIILGNYNVNIDSNIDGNFCSIFNIYSAIFRICIKLFLSSSYQKTMCNFFILRFVLFHKLFHITDGYNC